MINIKGRLVVLVALIFIFMTFGCKEDEGLPVNEEPLENQAPFEFNVDILGVFHDRGTITWGPAHDIDNDPVYQTVYLEDKIVLNRSTSDSILIIKDLKQLREYHGKVMITDDKHEPLEVPFSFTTRKYWLTFDRLYNGVDGNKASGLAAALSADGGYVIFGEAAIGYKSAIYVFKVDSLGDEQWHTIHSYNRRAQYMRGTISQTSDGGYIVASQESLLKLDAGGNAEWQILDQSEEHYYYEYNFNAAIETDDQGFLVVGSLQKSGQQVVGLMTKFDYQGMKQWSKEFGTEDITFLRSIVHTADGNYQILGSSLINGRSQKPMVISVTPAGGILWSRIYENDGMYDFPAKIRSTQEGGTIFVSNYRDGRFSGYARIVKLNSVGAVQWEKVFKWNSYETSVYGIAEVDDGYVLSGNDGDARPMAGLAFKIDKNGELIWKRDFRPNYLDYTWMLRELLLTTDKGFFAMGGKGAVYSFAGKELGLWMMKLNDEGYVLK